MGQDGKDVVEGGRAVIAKALGCDKERLFFTSCGTESDAWAIRGAVWHGRHKGSHIVTTAVEHSAVLETCKWLETEGCQRDLSAAGQNRHGVGAAGSGGACGRTRCW